MMQAGKASAQYSLISPHGMCQFQIRDALRPIFIQFGLHDKAHCFIDVIASINAF